MSIPVMITPKELRQLRRELKRRNTIVCLDDNAYLKTLLVARDMLIHGENVKTPIKSIVAPTRKI